MTNVVHKPHPHDSGPLHVTGTAPYVDDLPTPANALHACFGLSSVGHATIEALDLSAVWAAPGVVDVVTAADIPGENNAGPVVHDEPLLADGTKLSVDAALDKAADLLRGRNIVGIGSPRASLESNYALRELVGAEHFYSGIEASELERIRLVLQVLKDSPLPVPNMRDIEDHDAVFVLGEDLTQTAARMALALRQSVKGKAEDMAEAMSSALPLTD